MKHVTVCSIETMTTVENEPIHRHAEAHEVWWVEAGRLEVEAEQTQFLLGSGELLVIPCGTWHKIRAVAPGLRLWKLVIAGGLDEEPVLSAKAEDSRYVTALFTELARLFPHRPEKLAMLVGLLLEETNDALQTASESAVMKRVFHELEETCHAPFSLAETARHAGMSKFHFSRKFKERYRLSPLQFTIRCRIERARLLLGETDGTLGDIASLCGYQSPTQFHAVFSRHTGETPKRYRKHRQSERLIEQGGES